jgi:hypothetical protein
MGLLLVQLHLAPQEPLVKHLQLVVKAGTLHSQLLQLGRLTRGTQRLLFQGVTEACQGQQDSLQLDGVSLFLLVHSINLQISLYNDCFLCLQDSFKLLDPGGHAPHLSLPEGHTVC